MTKLLDPVCGMTVDDTALRAAGYDDVAFCSTGCRTAFLSDPGAHPARLDGAEPMAKKCTCGKQEDGICRCGHDHDGHGHEGHDHAHHAHHEGEADAGGSAGGGKGDHSHGDHEHAEHSEAALEPVASGSGCCGGHAG